MEENSIYSSLKEGESGRCRASLSDTTPRPGTSGRLWRPLLLLAVGTFPVVVQRTEAATRCQLKGSYVLLLSQDAIQLSEPASPQALYTWPYHFLRKFGSDKVRRWGCPRGSRGPRKLGTPWPLTHPCRP